MAELWAENPDQWIFSPSGAGESAGNHQKQPTEMPELLRGRGRGLSSEQLRQLREQLRIIKEQE